MNLEDGDEALARESRISGILVNGSVNGCAQLAKNAKTTSIENKISRMSALVTQGKEGVDLT